MSISARIELELGGLLKFLRVTALSIVLLGLGALVSWTTNVAEIAPAVATLGRPLRAANAGRRLGGHTGAGVAGVPDADRRVQRALRGAPAAPADARRRPGGRGSAVALEVIDLLAAAVTVALRRADEMGDAITARGGAGQIAAAPARPEAATVGS